MTTNWVIVIVRVPSEPSRHRVAVWRELRSSGAVPLGQGTWTLPDVPSCEAGVARAHELAVRGDGELIVLRASAEQDEAPRMRELFDTARREEWNEFIADCGKFEAEIAREVEKRKLTLAELDEEEQSLERLRRWFRSLRDKDVFDVVSSTDAERALETCVHALSGYAELVYDEVHA